MKIILNILLLILFCLPDIFSQIPVGVGSKGLTSASDTVVDNGASRTDDNEIDRLIVDETISKAGHDFLELFFARWTWPDLSNGSFMMVVEERPFRGISTQVVISVNDLVVFESFLQARYEYLEYLAETAIEQTTSYLNNYELIVRQLEGIDMKGTGIY